MLPNEAISSGEVTALPNFILTDRKSNKMIRERTMFQMRENEKILGKILTETEANNLSDKEFKATAIKMLNELGKRRVRTLTKY